MSVWLPDPGGELWEAAEICGVVQGGKVRCRTRDGKEVVVDAQFPRPQNPDSLVESEDLSDLPHLDEPNVLETLRLRYAKNEIYTYTGPTLLALNPWQALPDVYSDETLLRYQSRSPRENKVEAPHVYDVARRAFNRMLAAGEAQAILVSGESGAGKTETTKSLMKVLASTSSRCAGTLSHTERLVLQSNPILEAFGNACTLRNHNSSRFGKFISLFFGNSQENDGIPQICGASIQTLLLEKSRVACLSPGERNYHILYQIMASESDPELGLEEKFRILGDGQQTEGDRERQRETYDALRLVGVGEEELTSIVRVLAAVLHIGNIDFAADTTSAGSSDINKAVTVEEAQRPLETASKLLGCSYAELSAALLMRTVKAADETVKVCNSQQQAEAARDGLCKALYGRLFQWVVGSINDSLCLSATAKGSNGSALLHIGILDIFGFEAFAFNSLEQLCINYANEKLQQQFMEFVFKLEQEEYEKEGIDWTHIDFPDNDECVAIFEARPGGLLSLLDEECRVPRGSDSGFAFKARNLASSLLDAPKMATDSFTISHYAQPVTYSSKGVLERNKDVIAPDLLSLMYASSSKFLPKLFPGDPKSEDQAKSAVRQKSASLQESIGAQFKKQLCGLLSAIRETHPHYIRCINPNSHKRAHAFEMEPVARQLRYSGVVEALKVTRAGFSTRFTFHEFFNKFSRLSDNRSRRGLPKEDATALLIGAGFEVGNQVQIGVSKVFLRQEAMESLEVMLSRKLEKVVRILQASLLRAVAQHRYSKQADVAVVLQCSARRWRATKQVAVLRAHTNAVRIQCAVRVHLACRRFRTLKPPSAPMRQEADSPAPNMAICFSRRTAHHGSPSGHAYGDDFDCSEESVADSTMMSDGQLTISHTASPATREGEAIQSVREELAAANLRYVEMQANMAVKLEDLESQLHTERQRVIKAEGLADAAEGALARLRRELLDSEKREEAKDSEIERLRAENAKLRQEGPHAHEDASESEQLALLRQHIAELTRQRARLTKLVGSTAYPSKRTAAASPHQANSSPKGTWSTASTHRLHGIAKTSTRPASCLKAAGLGSPSASSPASKHRTSHLHSPVSKMQTPSPVAGRSMRGPRASASPSPKTFNKASGCASLGSSPESVCLSTTPSPRHQTVPPTRNAYLSSPSSSSSSVSPSPTSADKRSSVFGDKNPRIAFSRRSTASSSKANVLSSPPKLDKSGASYASALGPIVEVDKENQDPRRQNAGAQQAQTRVGVYVSKHAAAAASVSQLKDKMTSFRKERVGSGAPRGALKEVHANRDSDTSRSAIRAYR